MHNRIDPYGYELFSLFHKGAELPVIGAGDPLQEGTADEGEYGEPDEIGYEVEGVDGGDDALTAGFLDLVEHMCPQRGYFFIDLLGDLGCIPSYLVDDEYREVGIIIKEVDIGCDDALDLLLHGGGAVQEVYGDAFDELTEVVDHDDVEQFLLAPEIVVKEGEVDACLFGDVAGAGGCEAVLGKELFGGLHDLFFRGETVRGGGVFPGGAALIGLRAGLSLLAGGFGGGTNLTLCCAG